MLMGLFRKESKWALQPNNSFLNLVIAVLQLIGMAAE
jgi:hypothetical protein